MAVCTHCSDSSPVSGSARSRDVSGKGPKPKKQIAQSRKEQLVLKKHLAVTMVIANMQREYMKILKDYAQRAAVNIRNGQTPIGILLRQELIRDLRNAKRANSYKAAYIGHKWAGILVKDLNKQEDDDLPDELVQAIEDRLDFVSKKESDTITAKILALLAILLAVRISLGGDTTATRGLTPEEMVLRFQNEMASFISNYSEVVASTMTVWSENEAVWQVYRAAGVPANEWVAVGDDRTCSWCMDMDGTIVASDQSYLGPFEQLNVGGRVMTGFDLPTFHPPLHCRCRCGLIPVII